MFVYLWVSLSGKSLANFGHFFFWSDTYTFVVSENFTKKRNITKTRSPQSSPSCFSKVELWTQLGMEWGDREVSLTLKSFWLALSLQVWWKKPSYSKYGGGELRDWRERFDPLSIQSCDSDIEVSGSQEVCVASFRTLADSLLKS